MRFSAVIASLATVATVAAQAISFTSVPTEVEAGKTYTLQWSPSSDVKTVTILLRWGEENNLNPGNVLASNLQNTNSYQWTVPSNLFNSDRDEPDTRYAFEIKYDNKGEEESNYSGPIAVSGGQDFSDSAPKASSSSSSEDSDSTSTVTETTDMTTTMTSTADTASATSTDNSTTTQTTRTRSSTTQTEEADDADSTPTAPNGGSVARSSSLAMIFCILAAVFYLN